MLTFFSALGAGVRQSLVLPQPLITELEDLLSRIQLRPGSYVKQVAQDNLAKLSDLSSGRDHAALSP